MCVCTKILSEISISSRIARKKKKKRKQEISFERKRGYPYSSLAKCQYRVNQRKRYRNVRTLLLINRVHR